MVGRKYKRSMLQDNLGVVLAGVALLVLAIIAVSVKGCGCRASAQSDHSLTKDELEARAAKEREEESGGPLRRDAATLKTTPKTPTLWPAVPPPERTNIALPPLKQPARGDDDDSPRPTNASPKSTRPEDVAQWKQNDYFSAKRDGDPRLADAVAWLGDRFAGKASAAELLVKLLESETADPSAKTRPRRPPAPNPKLAEAIVAALAANGTPLATKSLERLVTGELETADKQVAAVAALKALAGRPGREGEDAIFRAATASRPADSANRTGSASPKLRSSTMELIKSTASDALRVRLARHATQPQTPQELFDELWDCLKEPRAENLAAQIIFYQSSHLKEKAAESLEEQFSLQTMAVLGQLLGLPSRKDRQPDSAAVATDPDRAAGLLWSSDLTAVVSARLRMVEGLTQGRRLLRLAAAIPSQPMRVATLQTLDKHWEEGPRALETLLSSDSALQEPGFLLVVKKLPRKDPPPAGRSTKSARIAAANDAKRRQDEVAQQWMTFSENLVRAMCRRFYTAALTPSADSRPTNSDAADLPLKPPSNVEIAASYRVDWPEGLTGKLAGPAVSPLRVRYLRIEQKARPVRLLAYYRSQLSNCSEHNNQYGFWLDAFATDKQRGAVRSVDVLITNRNKDIPIVANEEQQLTVDILFVEIESAGRAPREAVSSGTVPIFVSAQMGLSPFSLFHMEREEYRTGEECR